ncbi:MAG: cyclase family protein [Patescibacteria group bacterium]
MKVFDISRSIAKGEPIYPGNWPVNLERIKKYERDGSTLSGITLGLHTASHLDLPPHYAKSSLSADKVNLEKCFGWARVIDMSKIKTEITAREINRIKPKLDEILLLKTKNSAQHSKKFNKNFIHLNESAAKAIVKSGIKAVGIDGPSIRKFGLRPDTVHPLLLKRGVLIYEGLLLSKIKPGRYYFFGLPLKIAGGEASPVRAVLIKS